MNTQTNYLKLVKQLAAPVNQIGLSRYVQMVNVHREQPLNPWKPKEPYHYNMRMRQAWVWKLFIINNELVRKQKDDKDDYMVERPKESVINNV